MAYNTVVYGEQTLIDLTNDTVDPEHLLAGKTAHDKSGDEITGTCDYDAATGDATAEAADILEYTVPAGYHNGSGKVSISATEQAKIIPDNIKSGVTILGVSGSYSGAAIQAQAKSITPTTSQQIVQPDAGYDYLSQVTVAAIPYSETSNAAGGTTVTIGA